MLRHILQLIFPPKCILCNQLLAKNETDLCTHCRVHTPEFVYSKNKFPFVAGWTALWYYKDTVRNSLLSYKFYRGRSNGRVYGRLLAMKLYTEKPEGFDIITFIPVSFVRKWKRGFDQVELIARSVGQELGAKPVKTLKKLRNNVPQSTIKGMAQRRANVLGAYRVRDPKAVAGKRILLLDDIITTGATASECAKTLLLAGAKEVYCAAVAAASHDNK